MLPLVVASVAGADTGPAGALPHSFADPARWQLVWQDEFDYPDAQLDANWESQNGPNNHILCSRWRENAVVQDGILRLENRKETRGGQDWTSGSIWTHRDFKYGYFECRYRYAEATATNNSFWLMTRLGTPDPSVGKRFEIDINEGHYPNEVNTNIHNWSDITIKPNGKKTHPSHHKGFPFGTRPDVSLPLEIPVTTTKIRLSSTSQPQFHIRELRVYGVGETKGDYPAALSETADTDTPGLVNHARSAAVSVTASGVFDDTTRPADAVDGVMGTSWVAPAKGERWIELAWPEPVEVGCVQFINGWTDQHGNWHALLNNYTLEYLDGDTWVPMATMDASKDQNFGRDFHTVGLEWTEDELVFYHDGVELRREPNTFCYSPAPIWLSLAIIHWDGPVGDAVDGTSMKVDWVRYYQEKK